MLQMDVRYLDTKQNKNLVKHVLFIGMWLNSTVILHIFIYIYPIFKQYICTKRMY